LRNPFLVKLMLRVAESFSGSGLRFGERHAIAKRRSPRVFSCTIIAMFARRTGWNLSTNAFTHAVERHQHSGRQLFDLTASNPTRVGLQPEDPQLLQALANPQALDYDPQPRGLLAARDAVAGYYGQRGEKLDPSQIILTTSTSEAYSFVFRLLCNPDDEVLIPAPSYPLFEFLADVQDVRLVPYELIYDHGWQVDFYSLTKAITARTRAIILVNPNNPTGSFVQPHEREELNRICCDHDLALVVDEVFLDFNLGDRPSRSFATNQAALTFTLSGLSKISGLPQMKVAWLATTGPKQLASAALERLEVIADTYLSMNAPIQLAASELLLQRKNIQPLLLDRLRTNLAEFDDQLAKQKSSQRLQVEGDRHPRMDRREFVQCSARDDRARIDRSVPTLRRVPQSRPARRTRFRVSQLLQNALTA